MLNAIALNPMKQNLTFKPLILDLKSKKYTSKRRMEINNLTVKFNSKFSQVKRFYLKSL